MNSLLLVVNENFHSQPAIENSKNLKNKATRRKKCIPTVPFVYILFKKNRGKFEIATHFFVYIQVFVLLI